MNHEFAYACTIVLTCLPTQQRADDKRAISHELSVFHTCVSPGHQRRRTLGKYKISFGLGALSFHFHTNPCHPKRRKRSGRCSTFVIQRSTSTRGRGWLVLHRITIRGQSLAWLPGSLLKPISLSLGWSIFFICMLHDWWSLASRGCAFHFPMPTLGLLKFLPTSDQLDFRRCDKTYQDKPLYHPRVLIVAGLASYRIALRLLNPNSLLLFLASLECRFQAVTCPTSIMASMAAANSDQQTQQPTCMNCQTSTTPLWRRDEAGQVLCNACGLFLKLHGRPRPISLKTDVIKSRNRVKTMRPGMEVKKKVCTSRPTLLRPPLPGPRPFGTCPSPL